jgi:hypothetical protein
LIFHSVLLLYLRIIFLILIKVEEMHQRRRSLSPHRAGPAISMLPLTARDGNVSNGHIPSVACNESLIASGPPSRNVSAEIVPFARRPSPRVSRDSPSVLTGRHHPVAASISVVSISDMTTASPSAKARPVRCFSTTSVAEAPQLRGEDEMAMREDNGLTALRSAPTVHITEVAPLPRRDGPTAYEAALDLCCSELLGSVKRMNELQEQQRLRRLDERRRIGLRYRHISPPTGEPRPRRASSTGRRQQQSRRDLQQAPTARGIARSHSAACAEVRDAARPSSAPQQRQLSQRPPMSEADVPPGAILHVGAARQVGSQCSPRRDSREEKPLSCHPAVKRRSPKKPQLTVSPALGPSKVTPVLSPLLVPSAEEYSRSNSQRSTHSSVRPAPIPLASSFSVCPFHPASDPRIHLQHGNSGGSIQGAAELLLFVRPRPAPRPWRLPSAASESGVAADSFGVGPPLSEPPSYPITAIPVHSYRTFVPTFALHDFHRRSVLRQCWAKILSAYKERNCERFRRRCAQQEAFFRWRSRTSRFATEAANACTFRLVRCWKHFVAVVRAQRASRAVTATVRAHSLRRVFYGWLHALHTSHLVRIVVQRRNLSRRANLFHIWASQALFLQSQRSRLLRKCWMHWCGERTKNQRFLAATRCEDKLRQQTLEALVRHSDLMLCSRFWGLWRRCHRVGYFRRQLEDVASRSRSMKLLHVAWRRWTTRWVQERRARSRSLDR